MALENWENTLDQLYKNYAKKCKKISKEIIQLSHMETTIRMFEVRFNDETEKLRLREESI